MTRPMPALFAPVLVAVAMSVAPLTNLAFAQGVPDGIVGPIISGPVVSGPVMETPAGSRGLMGPDAAPVFPSVAAPQSAPVTGTAPRGVAGDVTEILRALDAALSSQTSVQTPVDPGALVPTQTVASGVLVELYTSQGCASCPPADAILAELATRTDVFPLALHVDYWDYLGWKDPFASPDYTARQKSYARARGSRTIYTPQMIVAGAGEITGPAPEQVDALIAQAAASLGQVQVRLGKGDLGYRVELSAEPPMTEPMIVQIVRYAPEIQVEILRGENAGKIMDYVNVVTAWHAVADWDGAAPTAMNVALDGPEPAILIVQDAIAGRKKPLPGAIRAAVRLQ